MSRRWWTNHELRDLRLWADAGWSIARVARQLRRTRSSVAGAAYRYGIDFFGIVGAPRGNCNAWKPREMRVSPEHRQLLQRLRQARHRARIDAAD